MNITGALYVENKTQINPSALFVFTLSSLVLCGSWNLLVKRAGGRANMPNSGTTFLRHSSPFISELHASFV